MKTIDKTNMQIHENELGHSYFKPLILICPSLTTMNLHSALPRASFIISKRLYGSFDKVLKRIPPAEDLPILNISSPKSLSAVIKIRFPLLANESTISSSTSGKKSPTKRTSLTEFNRMLENLLPTLSSTRNSVFIIYDFGKYFFALYKFASVHEGSFYIVFSYSWKIINNFLESPSLRNSIDNLVDSHSRSFDYRLAYHYLRVYYNSLHEVFFHKSYYSIAIYKSFFQTIQKTNEVYIKCR